MSVFTPLDVRGPDQRRKQLMQKLMMQGQGQGRVPIPPKAGSFLSGAGRAFGSIGGRQAPRVNLTHGTNILPSILSKLGVTGTPHPEEVSPGEGIPIPGESHSQSPNAPAGPPIPVKTPTPDPASPATDTPPEFAGLVPLGGGLYYDPVLDVVRGQPSSPSVFGRRGVET